MFRRLLIGGWGIYFAGVALVLVFPRQLVRPSSLAALLTLSLLLIPATVGYGFRRVYHRRLGEGEDEGSSLMKAVVSDERIGFGGGTGRYSRSELKRSLF